MYNGTIPSSLYQTRRKNPLVYKGLRPSVLKVSTGLLLNLCILGNFHDFFSSSADRFFNQNQLFLKNSFRNTIGLSYSSDLGQARHFVGPDLGPNCLQSLISADNELTLKAPPIICSRRQFQILWLYKKNK